MNKLLITLLLSPIVVMANHDRVATNLAINSIAASTYATSHSNRQHHVANKIDYLRDNASAIQTDIAKGEGEALEAALNLYQPSRLRSKVETLRANLNQLQAMTAAEKAAHIDRVLRS